MATFLLQVERGTMRVTESGEVYGESMPKICSKSYIFYYSSVTSVVSN